MPDIRVGERRLAVAAGSNLLDALLAGGIAVPHSCRAGSCHACLVHCLQGEVDDTLPEALDPARREAGWRLACQCRVLGDLVLQPFDPERDGLPARVVACHWLGDVLRLRLEPERPLRYRAGQHLLLWSDDGVARPYSLASLPHEDPWLEFHIDCSAPGAFCDRARRLAPGALLRLGELRGGALRYEPDWQERPLLLMAAGTGLAPLWGILREALRAEHQAPIQLLHLARDHYLASELAELAGRHPQVRVNLVSAAQLPSALADLRLVPRRSMALLCGQPASVERFARHLYLAGVPRSQTLADLFLPHAAIAAALRRIPGVTMSELIRVEREAGLLTLRLDRQDKKNALTRAMYSRMAEALLEAQADTAVRVVLITGGDACFTSGNDILDFLEQPPSLRDSPVGRFMSALLEFPKPVIAAVNGPAVGIGTTLLLHCDLVFVGRNARLKMPFVNLGLTPEFGSSLILPRMLGHARAAELLMLGQDFSGEQAAAWGLANAALEDGATVLEHARDAARRFLHLAPSAVVESKRLMKAPFIEELRRVIAEEGDIFSTRLRSPEAIEALSAFMHRRQPDFSRFA